MEASASLIGYKVGKLKSSYLKLSLCNFKARVI